MVFFVIIVSRRIPINQKRNISEEIALFLNEKLGKRLTRRGVEHIIQQIAQVAGVECDFNVSPHKLRHTCATVLYNKGDRCRFVGNF